MSDAVFAPVRKYVELLKKKIAAEYKQHEAIIADLHARGRDGQVAYATRRLYERVRPLRRDLTHFAMRLPPFATIKAGVIHLHPITDANKHLLDQLIDGR